MTQGCGKDSCSNSDNCTVATPSLKDSNKQELLKKAMNVVTTKGAKALC
jgi:hypothetical protein